MAEDQETQLETSHERFWRAVAESTSLPYMTHVLIALNVSVYLLMLLNKVDPVNPSPADLIAWGADYGPATLSGQWWRLLSSTFVHIGGLHILLNMWVLWDLGRLVERLLGKASFVVLYLTCGVLASLTSLAWNHENLSAGASGAIFGLGGAFIAYLIRQRAVIPPGLAKRLLKSMLLFVGINVGFGLSVRGIDNGAHLGGLAAGLLFGWLLAHPPTPAGVAGRPRRVLQAILCAAPLIVVMALLIPRPYPAREMNKLLQLSDKGNAREAIQVLDALIKRNPGFVGGLTMRGLCHLRERQYDLAIRDFTLALRANPRDAMNLANRALCYEQKGQSAAALRDLTEAIRLIPRDPEYTNRRGFVYLRLGQDGPAEADWRRQADLSSDTRDKAGALENIGLIYLRQGQWALVLKHAASVAELDPQASWNPLFQAIAADKLGQRELARQAFARWGAGPGPAGAEELRRYLPTPLQGYLKGLPAPQ